MKRGPMRQQGPTTNVTLAELEVVIRVERLRALEMLRRRQVALEEAGATRDRGGRTLVHPQFSDSP